MSVDKDIIMYSMLKDMNSSVAAVAGSEAVHKGRLPQRAATDKALVLGFHFPLPGLGHISQKQDAWQWQPINTIRSGNINQDTSYKDQIHPTPRSFAALRMTGELDSLSSLLGIRGFL